jgi:hypothetical protein
MRLENEGGLEDKGRRKEKRILHWERDRVSNEQRHMWMPLLGIKETRLIKRRDPAQSDVN